MTSIKLAIRCACIASSLLIATSQASAAEKLGDILCKSKWGGIIGTWVDADTSGANDKVTYAWKIKDRVIEVTTNQPYLETVALMGVNAKTGDVFHMGADCAGASSLGSWEAQDNGYPVLGIGFTNGDGQEGALSIRHHRENENTILVTIELPQPINIKLIRASR